MSTATARFQSRIPVPRAFVWERYTRPGMFERLSPPWQHIKVLSVDGGVRPGERVVLRPRLGPLPLIWEAIHGEYVEGRLFSDRQGWGPFASWEHRHHFLDDGAGCLVRDVVAFRLPLALLSHPLGLPLAARELRRMFFYRHFVAFHDMLEMYALKDHPRRTIAVRGDPASARSQIAAYLSVAGHDVLGENDRVPTGAVTIDLAGTSSGALAVRIAGAGEDGRELHISTGLLLDRASVTRLCIVRFLASDPDRPLDWTTLSDVAAAIHRAALGLYPAARVHVAHRTPATPRELARSYGAVVARLAELIPPSDGSPERVEAAGGDVLREHASRYRDAAHASRVMDGRP